MDFRQSSDQQDSRGLQPSFCPGFWTQCSESARGLKGCCPNRWWANFPLLSEEGWPRHQQNIAKLRYGADGVVIKFRRILLRLNTTPSARAKDASRRFLDRAATPPRRGGENSPLHHFWQRSYAAPRQKTVLVTSVRLCSNPYI